MYGSSSSSIVSVGNESGAMMMTRTNPECENSSRELYKFGSWEFDESLLFTIVCVIGAALASGLTLGLLSIEEQDLEELIHTRVPPTLSPTSPTTSKLFGHTSIRSDDDDNNNNNNYEKNSFHKAKTSAIKLLPLIRRRHHLLVTLLLTNAICNEALPIFLDGIVPSWLAITLSVTLILIFAEILPSALFTSGDRQLVYSSKFVPVLFFLMFITAPITYTISKFLDFLVGTNESSGNGNNTTTTTNNNNNTSWKRHLRSYSNSLQFVEEQQQLLINNNNLLSNNDFAVAAANNTPLLLSASNNSSNININNNNLYSSPLPFHTNNGNNTRGIIHRHSGSILSRNGSFLQRQTSNNSLFSVNGTPSTATLITTLVENIQPFSFSVFDI